MDRSKFDPLETLVKILTEEAVKLGSELLRSGIGLLAAQARLAAGLPPTEAELLRWLQERQEAGQ